MVLRMIPYELTVISCMPINYQCISKQDSGYIACICEGSMEEEVTM
jgi:hypothetical protein